MATKAVFGRELRNKEFYFPADGVFLNHGSYGAVSRKILKEQFRLKEETESHPDQWYRKKNAVHYRQTLDLLCTLIGTRPANTVLVENATFGLHSALFSLDLQPSDVVLTSNFTYHAVQILVAARGVQIIQTEIVFPPKSEDQIVATYEKVLKQNPNIKVAMLDHVSSPTSVVMPVARLVALCRAQGVITIIDGAHALGQLQHLNVESLGADFYTGNIHKWFFVPRGAAYLWVSPAFRDTIRPAVVSHFHGNRFHFDFCVRGTRDDTGYYTLPLAVEFVKELGGMEVITKYNTELLDAAVERLEKAWNTKRLDMAPSLQAPFMRLIQLPDMYNYPKTSVGAGDLENDLFGQYRIQVLCMLIQGELYIRISCHVYTCMQDIESLEKALLELKEAPPRRKLNKGYELPIMHWDLSPLMFDDINNEKPSSRL